MNVFWMNIKSFFLKEGIKVLLVHVFNLKRTPFSSYNVCYGHKESQSTFDFGKVKV